VTVQRAHQRTGFALRPQRRVDFEARRCQPHRLRGQLGSGAQFVFGISYEDHINVRDVVEFGPAALAHGDHGQPWYGPACGDLGDGHGQRGAQHPDREVSERVGDLLERHHR
jgi:hypothetical protein